MMLIGLPVADTIGLYRVWSRWRATFAGDLRGRLVLCFFKADFWHSLEQKKITLHCTHNPVNKLTPQTD